MNQIKEYLQSLRQHSSPKTRALEQELDAIRETHASASATLEKAQEDLQRAREADAQLLAKLQQQLNQIESERAHAREQIERLERALAGAEQHQKSTEGRVDTLETRLKEEVSSANSQVAHVQGLLADTEQRQKSSEGRVDMLEARLKEEAGSARDQLAHVQGLLADAEQLQKSTEGRVDMLEARLKEEAGSARDQLAHVQGLLADAEQHRLSTDARLGSLETGLDEEHSSTHKQVAQIQRLVTDTVQHLKSAESRLSSLEIRHGEDRSRHEASLHATEASQARIQDEHQSLLARQSELTSNYQGVAIRLHELQQVAGDKPPQSRLMSAVITVVLLVTVVLAGVFIMQGMQDSVQELAMVEQDIRDMRVFMKERIDNQDAALNDLALALDRQVSDEPAPVVQAPLAQATQTQEADEQSSGSETFTPDVRELQAGLITLGFDLGIPGPNGEAGVKTRQALQEFRQFYLSDSEAQDGLTSEPLVALILKSADIVRADAARFNIRRDVLAAIRLGSIRTGVDFSFLMELARAESNFNPTARAPLSSATGLFQFRDHAWLEAIRTFGAGYGLQEDASRLEVIENGDHEQERIVRDPLQMKVLALRLNPRWSTLMMAENIKRNLPVLSDRTGQEPGRTELYLAHFLGPDGAVMFLGKLDEGPDAIAADLFPQEAESNPGVFQYRRQQPRTLGDVYRRFERKFNTGRYDERVPG